MQRPRRRGPRDVPHGLGDAALYPTLLDRLDVQDPERRERILTELADGDFVALETEVGALDLDPDDASLLLEVPRARGGPEVLQGLSGPLEHAATGMRAVHALLPQEVADRIIFDLGLVRGLGYYTGAVFQVYDPAYGVPIGIGGRYDDIGNSAAVAPPVGFSLNVERLHIALTSEERGRPT